MCATSEVQYKMMINSFKECLPVAVACYRQTLKYVTNTMKSKRNNSFIRVMQRKCALQGNHIPVKISRNSGTGAPG
jgi:hypothetical protein